LYNKFPGGFGDLAPWPPSDAMNQVADTGAPYAGGFLAFYSSGTLSPLATYSNRALTVPNQNPVPLNSAGWAGDIFLQNLPYKVILSDSNKRMLVFTSIDSSGDEPRRGNSGLMIEVGKNPHLQTMIMNAHARALIDGPLTE
jgi:hypothetical protein